MDTEKNVVNAIILQLIRTRARSLAACQRESVCFTLISISILLSHKLLDICRAISIKIDGTNKKTKLFIRKTNNILQIKTMYTRWKQH